MSGLSVSMKKLSFALSLLFAVVPVAAQNQARPRIANSIPRAEKNMASRDRTVSTNQPTNGESANKPKPVWGDSAIVPKVSAPIVKEAPVPAPTNVEQNGPPPRFVKTTRL